MSTLKANIIDSTSATTDFKDTITANGDKQWVDSYGVIKTNRTSISENVTIPTGINGLSAGPITISPGYQVTVSSGSSWVIV